MTDPRSQLYIGSALTYWSAQLWHFANILILMTISTDLRLVAINGLIANFLGLLLVPSIGRWIETTNRLEAAHLSLSINNAAVVLSTLSLFPMLLFGVNGVLRTVLISISFLLFGVSIMAETAVKGVKADWVKVVNSQKQDKQNIALKIDLSAMLVLPLVFGLLMTSHGVLLGSLFLVVWHAGAWLIEYKLINDIYAAVPALVKKQSTMNGESLVTAPSMQSIVADSHVYLSQSIFPATLSLGLLYITTLDLGAITMGYAYFQGLSAMTLSLVRAVGALTGLLGTVLFPHFVKKIGLVQTGLLSLVLECSCLALTVLSICLPGSLFNPSSYFSGLQPVYDSTSTISIATFFLGIVLARCGLWMADLSVTQLTQDNVKEGELEAVERSQNRLNHLLAITKDILVIAMPDPRIFGFLIMASWTSIFSGVLAYKYYADRHANAKVGKKK
uniref:Solute carrier family 40 member n=1 Tax=Plectus sambesii TaxID=2011161 RepID=A0A914VF13_9BILA